MYDLVQEIPNQSYKLTDEGQKYVDEGAMPEAQVFRLVANGPVSLADLKKTLGAVGDIGFKQAMQQKWVGIDKSSGQPMVVAKADAIEDSVLALLKRIDEDPDAQIDASQVQPISKRKLVVLKKWSTFSVKKGPKFALERKKQVTDLTGDMLHKGTWKDEDFKEYNFDALGLLPEGGYLHPLLKVRTQFRKIFTNMGFQEMPTNNYVESSFWNFDALFQPQQHPARDAHDTFFLTRTYTVHDYIERVFIWQLTTTTPPP